MVQPFQTISGELARAVESDNIGARQWGMTIVELIHGARNGKGTISVVASGRPVDHQGVVEVINNISDGVGLQCSDDVGLVLVVTQAQLSLLP
jgi:hypothetical protein